MSTTRTNPALLPKKILIAFDGSENANRALEYGIELAKKLGASIILLHVVDLPRAGYGFNIPISMEDRFKEIGKGLLSKGEEKLKQSGLDYEVDLSSGDPAQTILLTAEDKFCGLILMGRRGLGRMDRLLLGSVSDKVAKHSSVPVLILK